MFYYVIAVACIFVVLLHFVRKHRKTLPLPPGPKGLPLIGNALNLLGADLWERARTWEKDYGPLICLHSLGMTYIFVNSYEDAVELLEKRGNIYSSRPQVTMFELEGWQWFAAAMPYGDELRRIRTLLHRFLQSSAVKEYHELQTRSIHKMLERLLETPDKLPEALRHALGEIIINMSYGFQVKENNDPYVEIAEKGAAAIVEAEDFFLVNIFPMLQHLPSWFPGAGFKKIVEEGHEANMAMYNEPYELAKKKINDGTALPSIVSKLHEAYMSGDPVINDEALIKKVAGVIYGAGTDTTVSSLHTFCLAMFLYPEVQRRAQDELDEVIGKDSLPSFKDRPNLPYVEAVIKEVLRWQPVTPLAVVHTADEDDEYKGYLIPKGTSLLPNIWAMQRNPEEYPEPDEFIPERWLSLEGKEQPLDVHKTFFGFGRRLCVGKHFADDTIYIGAASILAAFDITKALDEKGVPIASKAEYTPHFVRHPKPFKYVLKPRSRKIGSVIQEASDAAKGFVA